MRSDASKVFGRLDRIHLRWALGRWKKQILGIEIARLEEMNDRLEKRLVALSVEQRARENELESTRKYVMKKQTNAGSASGARDMISKQLCKSLDEQLTSTSLDLLKMSIKKETERMSTKKSAKVGDVCTSVTIMCGNEDLVVNIDANLTFEALLREVLEYWDVPAENYRLVEMDEDYEDAVRNRESDLDISRQYVFVSPKDSVQNYYCNFDKEPTLYLVHVVMPSHEDLSVFAPAASNRWLESSEAKADMVDSFDEVWTKLVEPHVFRIMWCLVFVALMIQTLVEVDPWDAHMLRNAIETPVVTKDFDSVRFADTVSAVDAMSEIMLAHIVLDTNGTLSSSTEYNFRKELLEFDSYAYVRQSRVDDGDGSCCTVSSFSPYDECYCSYNYARRSTDTYGNATATSSGRQYIFFDVGIRSATRYFGASGSYDSSGYFVRLPITSPEALAASLEDLVNSGFMDMKTRALIVTTRFVSRAKGLMATQILMFEVDISGSVLPTYMIVVQPLSGGSAWDTFRSHLYGKAAIFSLLFVLLVLNARYAAKVTNRERVKIGKAYHKRSSLAIMFIKKDLLTQLVIIVLLMISLVMKIFVHSSSDSVADTIASMSSQTDSIQWPTDKTYLGLLLSSAYSLDSIALVVSSIIFLQKIGIFPMIWPFVRSHRLAANALFQFTLLLVVLCIMAALVANIIFGSDLKAFSTYSESIFTMLNVLIGEYPDTTALYGKASNVIFIVFVVLPLFYILGSIYFGIHLDAYFIATTQFLELRKYRRVLERETLQIGKIYSELQRLRREKDVRFRDIRLEMLRTYDEEEDAKGPSDEESEGVDSGSEEDFDEATTESSAASKQGAGIMMTRMPPS